MSERIINIQTASMISANSSTVNLKPLKNFVKNKLKDYPITCKFILEEPEKISSEEFILKVKVWLQTFEKDIEIKESR